MQQVSLHGSKGNVKKYNMYIRLVTSSRHQPVKEWTITR